MVKAELNIKTGILHSTFSGITTVDEIVDYIRETKNNKSYPRHLKILTDATSSIMDLKHNDLIRIIEENYKSIEQYDFITDAIIIDSAKEVAISLLYQELAKTKKYDFKVFSTHEAAAKWLESK